jgi:hypothetical protein
VTEPPSREPDETHTVVDLRGSKEDKTVLRTVLGMTACLALALGVGGCSGQEGSAEKAGKAVDEAIADVEESADQLGEDMGEAADEMGDAMKDAADEMKEGAEAAGDAVKDAAEDVKEAGDKAPE